MTDLSEPGGTGSTEPAIRKGAPTEHLKPWQFKPGQSGNPSGRPKRKILKEVIDDFYNPETPEGRRRLEEFVESTHQQVVSGALGGEHAPNPDKAREFLHAVLDGPLAKVVAGVNENGEQAPLAINAQLVLHEGEAER